MKSRIVSVRRDFVLPKSLPMDAVDAAYQQAIKGLKGINLHMTATGGRSVDCKVQLVIKVEDMDIPKEGAEVVMEKIEKEMRSILNVS